jgi:hypothetical protein
MKLLISMLSVLFTLIFVIWLISKAYEFHKKNDKQNANVFCCTGVVVFVVWNYCDVTD